MPASRLGLTSSKSEVLTLTRMVRPAYTLLLVAATSTLLAAESPRSTLLFSSPSISKPDELGEQRHMVAAFMPEELPLLRAIHELPASDETRVISFGLYGTNAKYTIGAIRNAQVRA